MVWGGAANYLFINKPVPSAQVNEMSEVGTSSVSLPSRDNFGSPDSAAEKAIFFLASAQRSQQS
jgi:hypothetical protein